MPYKDPERKRRYTRDIRSRKSKQEKCSLTHCMN